MIFGYFTLLVALTISAVAEYYSIVGLTAIFSAAFWPIVIMGASLGVGKITAAVWLKLNWERASWTYKLYLVPAVAFLMVLTSMGIFGFLSKAHSDQNLISGDSMAKVAIYDENIKTAKDNIDTNRKALRQMDDAVDQVMGRSNDEKGADKAVAVRRSQQKERARLLAEIEVEQRKVAKLSEEKAPLAAEFRKLENEVGPIKYIAALVYGDNPDSSILEKAVRLVIILIVAVFDPLALVLILAAQQSLRWGREDKEKHEEELEQGVEDFFARARSHAQQLDQEAALIAEANAKLSEIEPVVPEVILPVVKEEPEVDIATKHPYLNKPFVHFTGLTPMVWRPEPDPKNEDLAAMNIIPPEEADGITTRPFTDSEVAALDGVATKPLEGAEALQVLKDVGIVTQDGKLAPEYGGEEPEILTLGIDEVERPGDYITPPAYTGPMKEVIEELIDPNTRIKTYNHTWVPDLSVQADNAIDGTQVNADFGSTFPESPSRGDMYVRVDFLPPRLFKFNGKKWMEMDKESTDSYYSEEYIKHLIDKINSGEYSVDELSENEQDQIRDYLSKQ